MSANFADSGNCPSFVLDVRSTKVPCASLYIAQLLESFTVGFWPLTLLMLCDSGNKPSGNPMCVALTANLGKVAAVFGVCQILLSPIAVTLFVLFNTLSCQHNF